MKQPWLLNFVSEDSNGRTELRFQCHAVFSVKNARVRPPEEVIRRRVVPVGHVEDHVGEGEAEGDADA